MDLFEKFKNAVGEKAPEPDNLFFKEHNANGYFTKSDFVDYVKPFDKFQFKQLEKLFKATAIKSKIANSIEPKMDPQTQEFLIWVHIQFAKGTIKVPIPHHEGMLKYLIDYQQTNIWFEADLESLLSEAGLSFSND